MFILWCCGWSDWCSNSFVVSVICIYRPQLHGTIGHGGYMVGTTTSRRRSVALHMFHTAVLGIEILGFRTGSGIAYQIAVHGSGLDGSTTLASGNRQCLWQRGRRMQGKNVIQKPLKVFLVWWAISWQCLTWTRRWKQRDLAVFSGTFRPTLYRVMLEYDRVCHVNEFWPWGIIVPNHPLLVSDANQPTILNLSIQD